MTFSLHTVIDCLLASVGRVEAAQRPDVLCEMFASLLPKMTEADVMLTRDQVINRLWPSIELADPLLNLIDGHLELRALLNHFTNEDLAENFDDSE